LGPYLLLPHVICPSLLSRDLIELDVERRRSAGEDAGPPDYTPVTRSLVKGVMERAQLLLNVTIAQNDYSTTTEKKVHDDAHAVTSPTLAYARSVSAPPMTVEISIRWAALEQH